MLRVKSLDILIGEFLGAGKQNDIQTRIAKFVWGKYISEGDTTLF